MKHFTALTITATVAALAAPAAALAAHPTRGQLEHRLTNMTLARKTAVTQLHAAQAQAAALEDSNTALQATVTNLEAQPKAAPVALPDPLVVAEEQVRREVAYQTANNGIPYSDGRLVSQAAMDYVVGHVSASAYGYLTINGLQLPDATADSVLATQAGICGHAALTFAAIVKSFGYQVRSVQFYYTDPDGPAGPGQPDSHIADEVYYDGGWHFFDPTFGNYWSAGGDVASITDARSGGGVEVKDDAAFTNLAENYFYGDGTAFETDSATVVTLDEQPFVD